MCKINRVKLYINDDEKSHNVAKELEKELINNHFVVCENDYDLGISVGGDGSFLRMIKETNFNHKIYYIGVNSGTLGFLQEIDINDTQNFVERLKNNDYKQEELSILETTVYSSDNIYKFNSLNEIVIRKNDFTIFKNKIYIDNEFLENFTGDGLLVSTATGSTAYNMSFGGSIIYNTLKAYILTPIAPINNKAYHTLTNSLVIPNEKNICISLNKESIFLMVDGKNTAISNVSKIEMKISKYGINCLRMNDFHFIKVVNSKIINK